MNRLRLPAVAAFCVLTANSLMAQRLKSSPHEQISLRRRRHLGEGKRKL